MKVSGWTARGGEHMAVIGIGKTRQTSFQGFEARNETVVHRRIHELCNALEPGTNEFRSLAQDGADPFAVDALRPFRTQQPGAPEFHDEITDRGGI